MSIQLTAAEQLLLRCTNPFAAAADIAPLLDADLSWDSFLESGTEHRLLPLIHHNLSKLPASSIPAPVAQAAKSAHLANAVRTEYLTAQLDDISILLQNSNVRAIPWKGPSLAKRIYPEPALRPADDLDFLVHPDDMPCAIAILSEQQFVPHLSMARGTRRRYLSAGFEYIMTSPDQGLWIELSSRQLPPPFSITIPPDLIWTDTGTLEPELYFLLLAMHGGKHSWDRLIWISDLCAFLSSEHELSLQRLAELAQTLRGERLLLAALDLTASTGLETPKLDSGEEHIPLPVLLNNALRSKGISSLEETRRRIDIYSRTSDTIRHIAKWLLAPTYSDWQTADLPDHLSCLYWMLRPLRILWSSLFRKKPHPEAPIPTSQA